MLWPCEAVTHHQLFASLALGADVRKIFVHLVSHPPSRRPRDKRTALIDEQQRQLRQREVTIVLPVFVGGAISSERPIRKYGRLLLEGDSINEHLVRVLPFFVSRRRVTQSRAGLLMRRHIEAVVR